MRRVAILACWVLAGSAGSLVGHSQGRSSPVVIFEGARLIVGDGSRALENGAFRVQNGRFTAVGRRGTFKAPAGATRIDLTGKTVMPGWINAHLHIGYEGYTSWGAQNYTDENVLDHLEREAFYGVTATVTVGSSPIPQSLKFQQDQLAGKYRPASRFFVIPGMAPPNGGPDPVLIKGTGALHALYDVSTPEEARAALRTMADLKFRHVKIWVDDRRGTYPKMTPEVVAAIVDEAHRHQMLVHAHALNLTDQKAVLRAGVDLIVHTLGNEKVDDDYLSLISEKKPYWAPVLSLGDRSEVCDNDPFVDQLYPAKLLAAIRATTEARPLTPSCGPILPTAAAREERIAYNFSKMVDAGARVVLGTDAGVHPGCAFGWTDHHEIGRYVQFGMTPLQALVAATQRPAELYDLKELGTLAVGKSADFVVLDANPLEDIRNTRRIASVYLRGDRLDRNAMLATWKKGHTTQ